MCGASSQQGEIENQQSKFYSTMTAQAGEVFGRASQVFSDLFNSFSPIVAAGQNQEGFSSGEKAVLNTQATEGTAQTYAKAAKAVGEQQAAQGGGNTYIPSGVSAQIQGQIADSAAAQESAQKTQIKEADYQTGRDNYFRAASGLAAAPGVFNPASEFSNSATNAGNSAANTANQMAQEDNSWVSAVTGMAGALGGAAITGGFSAMKPTPSGGK